MNSPAKVTTIVLVMTAVTALTSGLTTAYFLRASTPPASELDRGLAPLTTATARPSSPLATAVEEPKRPPIVHVAKADAARPRPIARDGASPDVIATAPTSTPAASPTVGTASTPATTPPTNPAPARSEPSATAKPAATTPSDCATGGERALRVAKPGVLGGLIGAGLGAVGGAIANGGKGAGKGALIGGLTGVAAGSAYGAYKTKQECGTIFGDQSASANRSAGSGAVGTTPTPATPGERNEASFMSRVEPVPSGGADEGITIYSAR